MFALFRWIETLSPEVSEPPFMDNLFIFAPTNILI